MDKNNSNIPVSGGLKNVPKPKSITPAVLGVVSSHGVKLPLNMTSENQKELLSKLEEWRKARRVKLAASILAKQKQVEKPKTQVPIGTLKSKTASTRDNGSSRIQTSKRQSVFERLYQNNGKIKKAEIKKVTVSSAKPLQIQQSNIKTPAILSFEKPRKPAKILLVEDEKTESLQGIIKSEKQQAEKIPVGNDNESGDDDDFLDDIKAENHMAADNSVRICKEDFFINTKATKPAFYSKNDQINNKNLNSFKNDLAYRGLPFGISSKVVKTEKQKNPLRRSISMMFRQKSKIDIGVRRSISAKNLIEISLNMQNSYHKGPQILPPSYISDKRTKNQVSSKSISIKRNLVDTPKSNGSLTSIHLRTKLEDWLKMNGHSLERYRHLRCFDIASNYKSVPRSSAFHKKHSFENLNYVTAPNTPVDDSDKENMTPPTVMQQVDEKDVENWLNELHRLIVELKYPSERCEEWLAAIRKKCANCSQLPIYWECLAALHESKGDLKSAIEDYERAIIKGGEVDAVGNSLAELFDKMVIEQKKNPNRKLERGLDPKNIFRSTIIKFALQQKALKKLSSEIEPNIRQQLYIATPVRRSTRIQTPFKSAEVNSLQTLTPEFLQNVKFKPNESLLSGN